MKLYATYRISCYHIHDKMKIELLTSSTSTCFKTRETF